MPSLPSTVKKAKKIALDVRKWAEQYAKRHHYDSDLCGLCAISSARLSYKLEKAGIPHKIAHNDSHAFVVCNGYIIDVTATQFGCRSKVVVRKPPKPHEEDALSWWHQKRTNLNSKTFYNTQVRLGWPPEQCAKPSIVKR